MENETHASQLVTELTKENERLIKRIQKLEKEKRELKEENDKMRRAFNDSYKSGE